MADRGVKRSRIFNLPTLTPDFQAIGTPAPERRLCRMPDASASAEPPVLSLLLSSWGSVPLVPNRTRGRGGGRVSGDPQRCRPGEVRAAPALVPDLRLSAPRRCLCRSHPVRPGGGVCDTQDTSCLLADMNGSRGKLSGRALTSPLLWSGGPGGACGEAQALSGNSLAL